MLVFPPEAALLDRPRGEGVTYVNIPVSPTSKKQLNYMELELQEPGPGTRGPAAHLPPPSKDASSDASQGTVLEVAPCVSMEMSSEVKVGCKGDEKHIFNIWVWRDVSIQHSVNSEEMFPYVNWALTAALNALFFFTTSWRHTAPTCWSVQERMSGALHSLFARLEVITSTGSL